MEVEQPDYEQIAGEALLQFQELADQMGISLEQLVQSSLEIINTGKPMLITGSATARRDFSEQTNIW